jgi:hypothetical protein
MRLVVSAALDMPANLNDLPVNELGCDNGRRDLAAEPGSQSV